MKKALFLTLTIFIASIFTLESCGPVVFSSRLGMPPPPWFYPNRIQTVRYIYFPDYEFYYDFSFRTYRYFDNNIWMSATVLPKRYNGVNLRRSKKVRIHNYFRDDLNKYHQDNRIKRKKMASKTFR